MGLRRERGGRREGEKEKMMVNEHVSVLRCDLFINIYLYADL